MLSTEGEGCPLMEKSNMDVASLPMLKDEFAAAVESSVSENMDVFEEASAVLSGLKLNALSAKKLSLELLAGESKEKGTCLLELWLLPLPTCGESKLNAEVVDGESNEKEEWGEVLLLLSDGWKEKDRFVEFIGIALLWIAPLGDWKLKDWSACCCGNASKEKFDDSLDMLLLLPGDEIFFGDAKSKFLTAATPKHFD